MKHSLFLFLCIGIGLILSRCNDPGFIGSDLLKEDEIALRFADTFAIEAQTILDTSLVYDPQNLQLLNNISVGSFVDPIFGHTEAGLFFQVVRSNLIPTFTGATLDSINLLLAYDTINAPYGVKMDLLDFSVYELAERISIQAYRSHQVDFSYLTSPLGKVSNLDPILTGKFRIAQPANDTVNYDPHLSIRLSTDYGLKFMRMDTLSYNSDSIFLANVRGFYLRSERPTRRMIHFNINSPYSRLQLVYNAGTTNSNLISFPIQSSFLSGPRVPLWKHEYSPQIKEAINNKTKGKEQIYIQSLAGPKGKLEFPRFKLDSNAIINKAELEFTVLQLPGDDLTTYVPPRQLALYRRDTAGNYFFISDQAGQADYLFLGGALQTKKVNGADIQVYSFNVSDHVQRIFLGKEKAEVYVGTAPTTFAQYAPTATQYSRVVLGGSAHPLYPVKLKISYTLY
jgi:hypothetical protein